ncbi:BON domain-containing protein [Endozoicomonas sp. Mp262]|uniref:BON domain-containing protein n=1 Tax=Endozoicomonas sp. Mp262 TaxID=2919499 RepID=UPI0021DA6066
MKRVITWILAGMVIFLSGCSTIVGSINEDPIKIDPAERTWGSWLDDQTLETVATVNIQKADPLLKQARIKVVSFNGTLLIIGQVPSPELKNLAGETVKNLDHVKQVYNELTVSPAADLLVQSNDSWLTTKIKTSLISEKRVSADRIKINTEKGTVYLMGIVSPKEAQAAVSVVRNTHGVQKIVKVFEYTP